MDILHYSSTCEYGNASEYVVPQIGHIKITSHGMGSGIYGLSESRLKDVPADDGAGPYIFTVHRPFVLDTEEKTNHYIEKSMKLQSDIQEGYDIDTISNNFVQGSFLFGNMDISDVARRVVSFVTDYTIRTDFVKMPINYILEPEFDGVICFNTSGDHWSKGNVKFVPYPTQKDGEILPVICFVTRFGITKKVYDLTGYLYEDKKFIKKTRVQRPKVKITRKCRVCGSMDHRIMECPKRESIMMGF